MQIFFIDYKNLFRFCAARRFARPSYSHIGIVNLTGARQIGSPIAFRPHALAILAHRFIASERSSR